MFRRGKREFFEVGYDKQETHMNSETLSEESI